MSNTILGTDRIINYLTLSVIFIECHDYLLPLLNIKFFSGKRKSIGRKSPGKEDLIQQNANDIGITFKIVSEDLESWPSWFLTHDIG